MLVNDAAKILELTGTITPEDTKKAYRDACKKFHPDINPAGEEMMKIVNAAYTVLEAYTGTIKNQEAGYSDALNNALNAILGLQGIVVEVCGAWVWVTGETKTHKDILKGAAFRWSNPKTAWYFRPAEFKSFSRGKYDLTQIREKYGSDRPVRQERVQIGRAA